MVKKKFPNGSAYYISRIYDYSHYLSQVRSHTGAAKSCRQRKGRMYEILRPFAVSYVEK